MLDDWEVLRGAVREAVQEELREQAAELSDVVGQAVRREFQHCARRSTSPMEADERLSKLSERSVSPEYAEDGVNAPRRPTTSTFRPLRAFHASAYARLLASELDDDHESDGGPVARSSAARPSREERPPRASDVSTRASSATRLSGTSRDTRFSYAAAAESTATAGEGPGGGGGTGFVEGLPVLMSYSVGSQRSPARSAGPAAAAPAKPPDGELGGGAAAAFAAAAAAAHGARGDGWEHPFGLRGSASPAGGGDMSPLQEDEGAAGAHPRSSTSNGTAAGRLRGRRWMGASMVDRALALSPSKNVQMQQASASRLRKSAERLVRSPRFECFTMAVIFASAVQDGLQTQEMASSLVDTEPWGYRATDVAFCSFFAFELFARLCVFRGRFFTMWGWGWNLFDMLLVATQLTEELLRAVAGWRVAAGLRGVSAGYVLRTTRLLRVVRTMRILHVMRFAEELRVLVGCIVHSAREFFWAAVLLLLMIYVASLSITQVVLAHRLQTIEAGGGDETDAETMALAQYYGTVPLSALSLFQAVFSGTDWGQLMNPLINQISPALGVIFCAYLTFVILAVLNIVTSTFVESVIQRAAKVKDVQKMRNASRLFKSIDTDRNGYISFEEIVDHLESAEVLDFFRSIDVDICEARSLFELLDVDGSGIIEFEEFLSGCIRLQGPAKAADLVLAMREIRLLFEEQSMLLRSRRSQWAPAP